MARGRTHLPGLALIAVACLSAAAMAAEPTPHLSALTAEELLNRGVAAYNAADFPSARAALDRFVTSFGDTPEGGAVLERVLPLLATTNLQEKRFPEALTAIDRYFALGAKGKPEIVEDLTFWRAVCLMEKSGTSAVAAAPTDPAAEAPEPTPANRRPSRRKSARTATKDPAPTPAAGAPAPGQSGRPAAPPEALAEAREAFLKFVSDHPASPRREEAILLAGACHSLGGSPAAAAAFLAPYLDSLSPVNRGRAAVMRLHALIQARDYDAAHALLVAEFPRSSAYLQLVSFHALALELGTHFLEEGEPRKAISCLQRVWTRDRLIRHQERRASEIEQQLAAARQRTADPFRILTLEQMIAKTRRELEHFKKIESFDAALRFRLGRAFIDMGRHREAALILEEMVASLPPDRVTEEAGFNVIRCWMQVGRWPRAIDAATRFSERFPKSAHRIEADFLRAQALQSAGQIPDSMAAFARIADDPAAGAVAARARFMEAFGHLLLDAPTDALPVLGAVAKLDPDAGLAELTHYWTGMAHSLAKDPAKAREVLAAYLKKHPKGRFAPEAQYRRAYCAHALRDYPTGIRELRGFLETHGDHDLADEARILLGDALLATGEIDKGILALRAVRPANTRMFEEAWFKIGRAFRLQDKPELLRTHMERFVSEHGGSMRVPEAVYWIGWAWRKAGQPEKAAEAYWAAIRAHGPDPARHAVEDLLLALPKLHPDGEARAQLDAALRDLGAPADPATKPSALAARALWLRSRLAAKADPEASRALVLAASPLLDLTRANPVIIADCAEGWLSAGNATESERLFRELLRWNPNSVQRDRAFAGLGAIAANAGRDSEALAWLDRFERETPDSILAGQVGLARAALLRKRGQSEEAAEALEKMLAARSVPRADKVRGLFDLGELRMAQGKPGLAVPYFQRIYVMYGRWPDLVAKAYLRSGEAFEKLADPAAARKTYEELIAREDLAAFAEVKAARERLARLVPAAPDTKREEEG
jgi:tetratricopeptide (TPR) repeat protein